MNLVHQRVRVSWPNIDIFGCTETWLNHEDDDSCLRMMDYCFYRSDSPSGRKVHGVGLFVKRGIPVLREHYDLANLLVLRIISLDLLVVLVYRPPRTDSTFLTQFGVLLNRISDSANEICVMGDFNLPGLAWNDRYVTRNATPHERDFYNMFNDLGLIQIVGFPTFLSSGNILDLILLTEEDRYAALKFSQPFPRCGHVIIQFDYVYNSVKKDETSRWDWARGNYPAITEAFFETDWDFEFSNVGFEEKCTKFCEIYIESIHDYIPRKSNRRQNQVPWMKKVPKNLIAERNNSWKRVLETRKRDGRRSDEYKMALRNYRTQVSNYEMACVSQRNKYEYDLLMRSKRAPKAFYSYIRKGRKCPPTVGPLKRHDSDSLVTEPLGMSEVFADSYVSVYTNDRLNAPQTHQTCTQTAHMIPFSVSELRTRLKRLNIDKAMGPDLIHPRVLRECADAISIPLEKIVAESLDSAQVPEIWRKAEVIPIHKGGDKQSALKYRPVSLTCLPCKLSEGFTVDALMKHFEENDVLSNSQFGFRPGRSVTDQLLLAYDTVTRGYDQGDIVDVLLLDFAKAFDKVSHEILLAKLYELGVRGSLL